jgi:hypothetical protein
VLGWITIGTSWWPAAARPQSVTTAAIYGRVTGADSVGIEDATVSVLNTANGERWHTLTRSGGHYALEYLSLGGPYGIEVRAIGFQPIRRAGVVLSLGERERVDLQLMPSVLTLPELAVFAAPDRWVNAGRTGPAQTITDTLISRLPVQARDFSQLTFLSPQATPTPSGGVSFAGQTDRLNGFQIDGATNIDLAGYAGGAGFGTPGATSGVRTLSVEAVRELQVITAPFDVRFGTFAAGLVNAVTQSGSNHWEGSLSGYFEDEALSAGDHAERGAAAVRGGEAGGVTHAVTTHGPGHRSSPWAFLRVSSSRNDHTDPRWNDAMVGLRRIADQREGEDDDEGVGGCLFSGLASKKSFTSGMIALLFSISVTCVVLGKMASLDADRGRISPKISSPFSRYISEMWFSRTPSASPWMKNMGARVAFSLSAPKS